MDLWKTKLWPASSIFQSINKCTLSHKYIHKRTWASESPSSPCPAAVRMVCPSPAFDRQSARFDAPKASWPQVLAPGPAGSLCQGGRDSEKTGQDEQQRTSMTTFPHRSRPCPHILGDSPRKSYHHPSSSPLSSGLKCGRFGGLPVVPCLGSQLGWRGRIDPPGLHVQRHRCSSDQEAWPGLGGWSRKRPRGPDGGSSNHRHRRVERLESEAWNLKSSWH